MSGVREAWDELAARAGLSRVSPRVVAVVITISVFGVGWVLWNRPSAGSTDFSYVAAEPEEETSTEIAEEPASAAGVVSVETSLVVHVAGAVGNPGVVRLVLGSRVADALEQAGGASGEAALDSINLARTLSDGEQVYVPTQDEVVAGFAPELVGPEAGDPASSGGTAASVNINTAESTQLETLPGVGPSTAAKIIADREANGPFSAPEDLMRVSGIGDKRLAELRDLITVR